MFDRYKIYIICFCVAYILFRKYCESRNVESFIVKSQGGGVVLSEDDVGVMLGTLFNTPKLSKASFVRILKKVVDIDVSKDYTVTSSQIIELAKKMPALKLYDPKRRRRIVHFYETDPNVKKLLDEHFLKGTEAFISSNDASVMNEWKNFKQLFGNGSRLKRRQLEKSENGDKYRFFLRKVRNLPTSTKLDTRTPQLEKLFKQFYKLKTGKEYSEGEQQVAIQGVAEEDMLEEAIIRILKSPEEHIKTLRNLQDAFEPTLKNIVNIRFDTPAFGMDANLYSVMDVVRGIIKGDSNLKEENKKIEVLLEVFPIITNHLESINDLWSIFSRFFGKNGKDERDKLPLDARKVLDELPTNITIQPFSENMQIKKDDPIKDVFANFYRIALIQRNETKNIKIGDENVIIDGDFVINAKQSNAKQSETAKSEGSVSLIPDMQKEIKHLRQMVQSVVDKTMEQKSDSDSGSDDNIYEDPASDALSKKMLAYLMKKKKSLKEFETFIRVMVITGREELNPLADLRTKIHRGISLVVSGDGPQDDFEIDPEDPEDPEEPEEPEEPEAFQGWK